MDAYADALGITAPKPLYTGNFSGDPSGISAAINDIKDPQERANARSAFEEQASRTQGFAKGANFSAAPQAPAAPKADPYADALGLNGSSAPTAAPTVAKAAPGSSADWLKSPEAKLALSKNNPQSDLALNQGTSLGSTIAGGYAGLYQGAKTLLNGGSSSQAVNNAANTVQGVQNAGTFTPKTPEAQNAVDTFGSKYNPANWIPNAAQWAGDKGGDFLAEHGMPAAGALVKGAGAAAPLALGLGKPLANMIKGGGAVADVPKIEPTMDAAPAAAGKPLYKLVDGKPVLIGESPPPQTVQPVTPPIGQSPANVPLSQVGKTAPAPAVAEPVPQTPEAVQQVAQSAPSKLFPETPTVAPAGSKFSPEEQAQRAQTLQSVGMDPNNLRKSAIEGDALGGSTDFQTAKIDTPAGRLMKSALDNEKSALNDHAGSIVQDTGGSKGLDQSDLYRRGAAIVKPLDDLKQYFDDKTSQLYQAADARAQGVPTQLTQFKDVLGDASQKTNSDRVLLPDAVTSYAKKLGMVGDDGSISGTAQQAETLRKYLGEAWSPQNSGFVGKLKDALTDDVTKSAGEDIYAQARALRAQRGATLDNPNGIAKLMDSSGPQGINRAVPVEKIPDQLTGMPVDQFSHVVKTLKNSPPELQPQSAAALAEIKAQFANKVQSIGSNQAGQWNAKGVTQYLQNNAARMSQVFEPEEIAKFRNLNDAGHIVAKDQSYPGAAIQGHNLMTHGVMVGLSGGGASLGGAVAGLPGAAVGGWLGGKAANAVGNASAVRAVNGRMVKLSDLVNK